MGRARCGWPHQRSISIIRFIWFWEGHPLLRFRQAFQIRHVIKSITHTFPSRVLLSHMPVKYITQLLNIGVIAITPLFAHFKVFISTYWLGLGASSSLEAPYFSINRVDYCCRG